MYYDTYLLQLDERRFRSVNCLRYSSQAILRTIFVPQIKLSSHVFIPQSSNSTSHKNGNYFVPIYFQHVTIFTPCKHAARLQKSQQNVTNEATFLYFFAICTCIIKKKNVTGQNSMSLSTSCGLGQTQKKIFLNWFRRELKLVSRNVVMIEQYFREKDQIPGVKGGCLEKVKQYMWKVRCIWSLGINIPDKLNGNHVI